MTARHLIVNADDLGLSASVNAGVVQAHEQGVVTSATLMVHGAAAQEAAAHVRSRPVLSLGLHVDLAEWEYREGSWVARYERVDVRDEAAVEAEVEAQLEAFRDLIGGPPTHLDSHQHVHRHHPVRGVVARLGERLGVPVRHEVTAPAYRGDFYGQTGRGEPYPQGLEVDRLVALVRDLPPGWTELGCHPGLVDVGLDNGYREERAVEVEVLCDPRVRAALEEHGVALASFHDLRR